MPQKILFATTDYSFFTKPVTQALQKLGYQVKIFDYNKPNLFARLTGVAANLHLLSQSSLASIVNQALLRLVNSWQPDYLLVIKGEIITAATIQEINRRGVITINWYSDWYDSWPWIITHAPAYSIFINNCFTTHQLCKKSKINSYYLPFAVPLLQPPLKKTYPVTFVGQYTPQREKYLKAIKHHGLKIWGHRWNKSSLADVYDGPVSVDVAHRIIRQSHIVVNPLIGKPGHQPNQVNVRTFETTGLGTFLLTQTTPVLSHHFTIGKELVTFINPNDLNRKVTYYLRHPLVRNRIAQAGYRRARRDHLFTARFNQLFNHLNALNKT